MEDAQVGPPQGAQSGAPADAGMAGAVAGAAVCRCPRCGDTFSCGARADGCWCQSLPPLDPAQLGDDPAAASCLCPYCLRQALELLQQAA